MRSPTSEHNSNRQPRVLCRWIEQLLRKEHIILLCFFGDGKGQKKGRAARPQTPRSKRSDGSTAGVCRHPLHYPDRLAPSVKKISVPYQSYHQTEISALSHHAVWKIYSCCVKSESFHERTDSLNHLATLARLTSAERVRVSTYAGLLWVSERYLLG